MAFDQAQQLEGADHDADFHRQKRAAEDLQCRLAGVGLLAQPSGLAIGKGDDKSGKEPIADHDHHQDIIFRCQMA